VGDLGGGRTEDDAEHGGDRDQQGRAGDDRSPDQQGGEHQQHDGDTQAGAALATSRRRAGRL
jgi:hypothetical protein